MQNPLPAMQSFLFGAGTDTPTYESLKRKRAIADMLAAQSVGGEYKNWGDGVGSIMKALGSRIMENKLGPQEDAERQSITDAIAGITGGATGGGYSGTPSASSMGPAGTPFAPSAPQGQPVAPAMVSGGEMPPGVDPQSFNPPPGVNPKAFAALKGLEGAWGQPLDVISDYRDPKHNAAVGGAKGSQHTHGNAFDVSVKDMPIEQRQKLIQEGKAAGFTGVGVYDNSLHFDIGPERAWGPSYHKESIPEWAQGAVSGGSGDLAGIISAIGGGGEPDMARVGQLADILSNPYATEGQQMVVKALIERELATAEAMSPYQAAQLGLDQQRLNLERDKFNDGTREGVQSFGNVYSAMRDDPTTPEDDPKMTPFVTDKAGNVKWLEMGGAEYQPPVSWQDLGTEKRPVYTAGGGTAGAPLPVDKAGVAAQTGAGETQATAAAGLPGQAEALSRITAAGQEILNDPVLPEVLGNLQGRLAPRTQAQADTQARIDRFLGQTFPMAMQSLRGLGPASEREGLAAQAAIANLDQKQSPEAFAAAINEATAHIQRGFEIAEQQAQGNILPAAPTGEVPDWMLSTPPEQWTPEQTAEAMKRWGINQ
jgi:hypothetical protein